MLPLALKHFSLPHLFSFHQQDFKAHFVSSATVPPFLPLLSLLSLQPSSTAGGEIISNTPSLFLASPLSLPSFPPSFLQHLPQHPVSPLLLFFTRFPLHLLAFNTQLHLWWWLSFTQVHLYTEILSVAHTQTHKVFVLFFKLVTQTYSFWNKKDTHP